MLQQLVVCTIQDWCFRMQIVRNRTHSAAVSGTMDLLAVGTLTFATRLPEANCTLKRRASISHHILEDFREWLPCLIFL